MIVYFITIGEYTVLSKTEIINYFNQTEVKKALAIIIRILERWGYNFTQAKIYAILVLSPIPLNILDIAKIAGLSRSAVSTILGKLSKDYLVHYHMRGKTKYYTAVPSFTSIFMSQPKVILEKEIIPLQKTMKIIMEKNPSYKKFYTDILKDIDHIHDKLEKCIKLLSEEQ